MPRLFTGIEIPEDIGDVLSGFRGGLIGARWIDPENYHLTLRFIGDIDVRTADEIDAMLADVEVRSIGIDLTGLASFGGDRPRSIHVVVEPSRQLVALQGELERRLRRLGLPPETRKFTPHVTLARLRGTSVLDVADYLATRGGFPRLSFTAERFALFSSRESVGGGPYLVEAAYPLA